MSNITIEFIYEGEEINIQCDLNEYMDEIIKRYSIKIDKVLNNQYFLYNGTKINISLKLKEIINNEDKKIKILVYDYNEDKNNNEIIKQSKDIICPKSGENCLINIYDYKISLNKCDKGHILSNILFNEYNEYQKINELKIICHDCRSNKNEAYDNKFYKCCICNFNFCPICKSKHDKNHILIVELFSTFLFKYIKINRL